MALHFPPCQKYAVRHAQAKMVSWIEQLKIQLPWFVLRTMTRLVDERLVLARPQDSRNMRVRSDQLRKVPVSDLHCGGLMMTSRWPNLIQRVLIAVPGWMVIFKVTIGLLQSQF